MLWRGIKRVFGLPLAGRLPPQAEDLGADQPFRYRGYVYDSDTQLYYLQSRYYDPKICRFISADILLSTGQGVIGHNSFAYCNNDPANAVDSNGAYPVAVPLNEAAEVDSTGSGTYPPVDNTNQSNQFSYPIYSSPDEAAAAWAEEWRNTDSECEYGAIMFEFYLNGEKMYRIGVTRRGAKDGFLGIRANVIKPLYYGILFDKGKNETPYALLHTHPLDRDGGVSDGFSEEDINCTKGVYPWVNLSCIYMIPYGAEDGIIYKYKDGIESSFNGR